MATPAFSRRKIAIIGAGLAGLSAAHTLLRQGHHVIVFEAAPQAGGRARGVAHGNTTLDNGQHLCIGAYSATLNLLQTAGLKPEEVFMRLPLALHMHAWTHNSPQRMSLVTPGWLPAPLHLLWGLLAARGLDWCSKWLAIRWMLDLKRSGFRLEKDITVAALLVRGQQTAIAISTLWEPLCLAALNTPIAEASAQVFLNVLQDSFQHRRQDSDFLIVKGDLSTALIQPLLQDIQNLGAELHLRQAVTSIQPLDTGCLVSTATSTVAFDDVVVAVGPHQLKTIESELVIPRFDYQPITTIYLQFESGFRLPHVVMGLCHGLAQWVFDRGQCCDQPGLLAVVISAHPPLNMGKESLLRQCIEEINRALDMYGKQLSTTPLWTQIITEKRATFSCTPDLSRPPIKTGIPHLFLAGDYVAGRYPATIEGTVRSGHAAAQAIMDGDYSLAESLHKTAR